MNFVLFSFACIDSITTRFCVSLSTGCQTWLINFVFNNQRWMYASRKNQLVRGIRILGVIFFNFLIFMLFTIPFLEVLTDGLQRHQHLWCPVVVFIIPYKGFESIKNILILKKFTHPSCCTDVISYKPQLSNNILSLYHKNISNPIDILGFPCYNKTEIKPPHPPSRSDTGGIQTLSV